MTIYDLFMYNGENDLLTIRINELKDVVDYFVIGESQYTHSGIKKELEFQNFLNNPENQQFKDKIIYFELPYYESDNYWNFEMISRQWILEKLTNIKRLKSNDIFLHGDLDEISHSAIIKEEIDNLFCPTTILSDYYLFCLNLWGRYPSPDTFIMKIGWITQPLYYYRSHRTNFQQKDLFKHVERGGCHYSTVGTPAQIARKLKSFAHAKEFDVKFQNEDYIKECIVHKKGFGDVDDLLKVVEINEKTAPKYLVDNQKRYEHLTSKNYII